MKLQIREFAELTGVSVRTLHYYDEIGLLKPSFVDEKNGYRFYDEASLERMQEILFYRELDFSLKSIAEILASPNYDKQKALARQKRLLTIKKNRLERLIAALEQAEKGEITMSVFDNSEYETARQQYEDEAKQRWGSTDAYKESQAKTAGYSKDKWNDVLAGMNGVFAEFSECKKSGESAGSETAQRLVKKLQDYITENFYHCTDDILAGLGQMYICDERFRNNIDKCGEGTAEFIAEAVRSYCRK
ncbi:MAG: MerR family transcriptional regulator [Ruminococcaceae bacterium]|nr:MerR family transcriptional regulator [Oscillospiraceae bacterium]